MIDIEEFVVDQASDENPVDPMHNESWPKKKIRLRHSNPVDHDTRSAVVLRLTYQDRVLREEGVEERGGVVEEVGEGESAVGDDMVAEGAYVWGGAGFHVEGEELHVFGSEESELVSGGGGWVGGEQLDLDVRGGDAVGEEGEAMVSECLEGCFKFLKCCVCGGVSGGADD